LLAHIRFALTLSRAYDALAEKQPAMALAALHKLPEADRKRLRVQAMTMMALRDLGRYEFAIAMYDGFHATLLRDADRSNESKRYLSVFVRLLVSDCFYKLHGEDAALPVAYIVPMWEGEFSHVPGHIRRWFPIVGG